jgi:hypothetical protein
VLITRAGVGGAVEVAADDKVVWGLTAKDAPEVKLGWTTGGQRLANANTIIWNWSGGGSAVTSPRRGR